MNFNYYLRSIMKVELDEADELNAFAEKMNKKKMNDFFVDRPFVVTALEKRVLVLRELADKFISAYSLGMQKLENEIVPLCRSTVSKGQSSSQQNAAALSELYSLAGNMGAKEKAERDSTQQDVDSTQQDVDSTQQDVLERLGGESEGLELQELNEWKAKMAEMLHAEEPIGEVDRKEGKGSSSADA